MQLISKKALCVASALTAACLVAPVQAHHSFAMFDQQKSLVLKGTVKEFQWTNPHSWLQVDVPNNTGGQDEWSIELNSISGLHQAGWRPKTILPGDKVTVTVHPLRDGTKGASLVSAVLPNGSVLGSGQGAPPPSGEHPDAAPGANSAPQ
jgi:hypothetical protein